MPDYTGQDGKGCAVWCRIGAYNHSDYETRLGIPVELALLGDRIFERLSVADAKAKLDAIGFIWRIR